MYSMFYILLRCVFLLRRSPPYVRCGQLLVYCGHSEHVHHIHGRNLECPGFKQSGRLSWLKFSAVCCLAWRMAGWNLIFP